MSHVKISEVNIIKHLSMDWYNVIRNYIIMAMIYYTYTDS